MTTEKQNPSEKKLTVAPTKTLSLKRGGVEQGVVRQSFSHGRTKAVVVERVRRRVAGRGEAKPAEAAPAPERAPPARRTGAAAPSSASRATASAAAAAAAASAAKPSG